MSKASAVASLGALIVESGKEAEAFGPIVTLLPLIIGGQPIAAEIDALTADTSTVAKGEALQALVGIVAGFLADPKYAAQTKAALKGLMT